jgi:hypothetical protein
MHVFCWNFFTRSKRWSRSNSVSVVSAYGLEDRAIKVRSPTEAKGSFPVTSKSRPALGSTQHPVQWVFYWKVLSPEVKSGQGMTLTTHPHLVQRSSRSYIYSPSLRLHRCVVGLLFAFRPKMILSCSISRETVCEIHVT